MQRKGLFAVLDWGLGHATRSETIIAKLIQQKIDLDIASSGMALEYLRFKFPNLSFHTLPEKEVKYSRRSATTGLLSRTLQQQKINSRQKTWLDQQLQSKSYNFLISDNVYGIYSSSIKSIIITHQLNPPSPIFRKLIQKKIARWLNRFHEVWIPDLEHKKIAGEMLSNAHVTTQRKYLGNISRFQEEDIPKKIDYLAIVSGPEPQAGILEDLLIKRLESLEGNCLIASTSKSLNDTSVKKLSLADQQDLNRLINSSKMVICRSGYTSVIDLLKTRSKAILIPTPGQPEQEYLARRVRELGLFENMSQKDLKDGVPFKEPESTPGGFQEDNLDLVLNELIDSIEPSGE